MWASLKKSRALNILMIIRDDVVRTDIVKHAYAMAYVTLFSLIPSLAATFALVSLFTPMFGKSSALITQVESFILKHLATGSGSEAVAYLETFLANTDFQKIGMTGFAGTLVALILLLKEVELALNRIFEINRARPILIRFIYFWTFLTLGTFVMAVSIGTLSSNKVLSKYVDISIALQLLGDFVYFGSFIVIFFLLYKIVPNRFIPLKHAMIGAIVSTFFLSLAVKFFSLYISSFTSYQAVYGALSALPIFLFWLYVVWFITLFGALITKRSMEGWQKEEVAKVEHIHEHLREPYFQSLIPFLVLVAIYQAYDGNEGQGASPERIAKELGVTLSPVRHALITLEKADLAIALQAGEQADRTQDTYFPRLPAHRLSYAELKFRLLGQEDSWLKTIAWKNASQGIYSSLVKAYLSGEDRFLAEDIPS
jgi:membrane protein